MEMVLVAPFVFRAVEGAVGLGEHGLRVGDTGDVGADASAHGDREFGALETIRKPELVLDAVSKLAGALGGLGELGLEDGELIAAEPCDEVGLAGAGAQAL